MKPNKKSTCKPLPKVWGQEPKFYSDGCNRHFFGIGLVERDGDQLRITTADCHSSNTTALRAIRAMWRTTFGGGK